LYLFSSGGKIALFVGSSNFTYGGFNCNIEANVLLEGSPSAADNVQISALRKQLAEWHSDRCSFVPSTNWLVAYRTVYRASLKAEQKHRIQTPRQWETEIGSASWIRNADWHTYYGKVVDGLRQLERKREGYIEVLTAASRQLPRPWKRTYFDDPECRRIIGGFGEYGWLGHVGASGHFRAMLAGGSVKQQDTIVAVINSVGSLSAPVDWTYLDRQLHKLTKLGPTMKVWSRLLCLVRPDLFCTVASIPVRQNLAKTLGIPQNRFEHPDGYIQLLKLLHASPWFQSTKPMIKEELEIWRRRAAFMDAIFYP
jgi:hypothetical protein